MTTQKNIDYKIEQLRQLTGLKELNDKWLNDKENPNGKSHRLESSDLGDYITPRYKSAKEFFYVLDSMVRLLEEAKKEK